MVASLNISNILRMFDFVGALVGLVLFFPIFIGLFLFELLTGKKYFFFQMRVGYLKRPFLLVKFRTMALDTLEMETHLIHGDRITTLGRVLRRYKLDELPQLWNVLVGEMSFVGPRPGLRNQSELIRMRENLGIFEVRPGITGLSQISGIDMSTPELLAQTDARMIAEMSVRNYFKYIFLTVLGKGRGDHVKS